MERRGSDLRRFGNRRLQVQRLQRGRVQGFTGDLGRLHLKGFQFRRLDLRDIRCFSFDLRLRRLRLLGWGLRVMLGLHGIRGRSRFDGDQEGVGGPGKMRLVGCLAQQQGDKGKDPHADQCGPRDQKRQPEVVSSYAPEPSHSCLLAATAMFSAPAMRHWSSTATRRPVGHDSSASMMTPPCAFSTRKISTRPRTRRRSTC